MLFFLDELWEQVGPRRVGALGGLAIPEPSYNYFCRDFLDVQKGIAGTRELGEWRLGGHDCFGPEQFEAREEGLETPLLEAGEAVLWQLDRHRARVVVIWTPNEYATIEANGERWGLPKHWRALLQDMYWLMEADVPRRRAMLVFAHGSCPRDEDIAYLVGEHIRRGRMRWIERFSQTPFFAPIGVSPGLQAAHLVLYLCAWMRDRDQRPELQPLLERVKGLGYSYEHRGERLIRTPRTMR